MISRTTIEDSLVTWIAGITGETVIVEDQSKPRPAGAYALVSIQSFSPVGLPGKRETAAALETVAIDYSQTYRLMASFNFYRTGAFENAGKMQDSLSAVGTIEDLQDEDLYFISMSEIRHISDVVNKSFEERHQFDVSFYVRSGTSENLEAVTKIEITDELNGGTFIIG